MFVFSLPSSDWLAPASVLQSKQLPEEDGEPGRSVLRQLGTAPSGSQVSQAWKTEGMPRLLSYRLSPVPPLSWPMCPGSWKHQGDPLGVGKELTEAIEMEKSLLFMGWKPVNGFEVTLGRDSVYTGPGGLSGLRIHADPCQDSWAAFAGVTLRFR